VMHWCHMERPGEFNELHGEFCAGFFGRI